MSELGVIGFLACVVILLLHLVFGFWVHPFLFCGIALLVDISLMYF